MTRSPTAAVREQAAQLCSAMASERELRPYHIEPTQRSVHDVADELGMGEEAAALAWNTWWSTAPGPDPTSRGLWSQAHAMLMNGEVP